MAESEKTLAQRWMDLLGEDGYRPRLELNQEEPERSRIFFKSEGTKFNLYLDDRDPTFFNLSLSYVLGDHSGASDLVLLGAANEENRRAKVTKVTLDLDERSACFSMEGFGEEVPSEAMFERMVRQCSNSADRFFTRLREAKRPVTLVS
jgi:hypothetical protein